MTDKKSRPRLSGRLLAVAGCVRRGAALFDVGTDHALLPVYLVSNGICPHAVASDIAPLPLDRARRNILAAGLSGSVETVLSDGLKNIPLPEGECDIVIAGMGGEMIASIIDGKPEVKGGNVRLILQPMTRSAVLRAYLYAHGFRIEPEIPVYDGKMYVVMKSYYDGEARTPDPYELYAGNISESTPPNLKTQYYSRLIKTLEDTSRGRSRAGLDVSEENAILQRLRSEIGLQ